jgi:hypothetical protein
MRGRGVWALPEKGCGASWSWAGAGHAKGSRRGLRGAGASRGSTLRLRPATSHPMLALHLLRAAAAAAASRCRAAQLGDQPHGGAAAAAGGRAQSQGAQSLWWPHGAGVATRVWVGAGKLTHVAHVSGGGGFEARRALKCGCPLRSEWVCSPARERGRAAPHSRVTPPLLVPPRQAYSRSPLRAPPGRRAGGKARRPSQRRDARPGRGAGGRRKGVRGGDGRVAQAARHLPRRLVRARRGPYHT